MARYTGPMTKKSRRLGVDLVGGDAAYERRPYPPGQHGRARVKESEYRSQLQEKQKARFTYGVLEKQFHNYYTEASRRAGKTGDNLLQLLECPPRQRGVPRRFRPVPSPRPSARRARPLQGQRQEGRHPVVPGQPARRDRRAREVARDDPVHRRARDPRRTRRPGLARGAAEPHARPGAPGARSVRRSTSRSRSSSSSSTTRRSSLRAGGPTSVLRLPPLRFESVK